MGSIKDRNGTDLTEAKDIKKKRQDYTEELYKKDLHDPDNHNGVLTNFLMFKLVLEKAEEPDIKLPTSTGSSKKWEFQKNISSCFIDYLHLLCRE